MRALNERAEEISLEIVTEAKKEFINSLLAVDGGIAADASQN